jgi:hypothetical protein
MGCPIRAVMIAGAIGSAHRLSRTTDQASQMVSSRRALPLARSLPIPARPTAVSGRTFGAPRWGDWRALSPRVCRGSAGMVRAPERRLVVTGRGIWTECGGGRPVTVLRRLAAAEHPDIARRLR